MPPKEKKEKKEKKPKKVKEPPQDSAGVLWLRQRTGFEKQELLDLMLRFKKIAADTKVEGKGKRKKVTARP